MTDRLFIYGTLAPGRPNEHVLAEVRGTWEPATVKGKLLPEGWGAAVGYPGIVLDELGGEVHGFIFNSEELSAQWARLDEFEGDGYRRVVTSAELRDGSIVKAHIYALKGNRSAQKIIIRDETDADVGKITEVTIAAFKTLEISNQTEQFIIEALRAAKALMVSLVAEEDGCVSGHVAFSPVTISDGTQNWYGLGPVSVLPENQRKGIGKLLIREGLSRLKSLNAQGCCLVGHPDYYRKFGFRNIPGFAYEGVPEEVFLSLCFDAHIPQGTVRFHEGFKATGQPVIHANRAGRTPV